MIIQMPPLDKVTAFITRQRGSTTQVLLLQHPYAGFQFPAGTVEEAESFEAAILREVHEETGLQHAVIIAQLGELFEQFPGRAFTRCAQTVYARPDTTSFDWATLPRGAGVDVLRRQDGFVHVSFVEGDVYPDPAYITYQITGWVREECLVMQLHRRIYHLTTEEDTPSTWQRYMDQHHYTLLWADVDNLPDIVDPQNKYWQQFGKQLSV
jgi:8-oxo-dGTP pyrophosphatase MutT (NUDIX family)